MKRVVFVCVLMGLLGFGFAACDNGSTSMQEPSTKNEDISILEGETLDQDNLDTESPRRLETYSDNQVMIYIQEHMEYAQSDQYDKDINPYFTGYLKELVDDIKANSGVKGYNILSAYDTLISFDFSQLDEEEEYELLLAQIFFNSQGERAIQENYAESFTRALINIANLLVDGKDYKDVLSDDNRQSLKRIINAISACEPGSAMWDQNVNGLFNFLDGYDALNVKQSVANNLTAATWIMCAIDTALDEIDLTQRTLSELVMYVAVCEAYSESNSMFSDLILNMRQHLAIKSDDSKFNPFLNSKYLVGEANIQNLLGMNQFEYEDPLLNAVRLDVLADALERFYSVLEESRDGESTILANYALTEMLDGTGFNLTYNASNAFISLFSALPVIREYEALRALVSTGKLMVELSSTVEDQSYNAKMVQRLQCMLLIESKTVDSVAEGGWDLTPINFEGSLNDYQFRRAEQLDMAVNVYKAILSCAAQYGAKYAQYRLDDAFTNRGKQWPSTLMSMMSAEQLIIDQIQCHKSDFEYDTLHKNTGADNVFQVSEIEELYLSFLTNREYTSYIDNGAWIGDVASEGVDETWSDRATGYAILDINKDGIPELLIEGNTEYNDGWKLCAVFTYDTAGNQIKFLNNIYVFGGVMYSPSQRAIYYAELRTSATFSSYGFYGVGENSLTALFSVGHDTYSGNDSFFYAVDGTRTFLTDAEKDAYFADGYAIDFLPLPTAVADQTTNAEDDLRNLLANTTSEDVLCWFYEDFDGDGTYEAYALTGGSTDDTDNYSIPFSVWFVSQTAGAQWQMESYGFLDSVSILTTGNYKFIEWEQTTMSYYYASAYIFGVKNGNAYQPDVSGQHAYFNTTQDAELSDNVANSQFYGTDFPLLDGGGHDEVHTYYDFDESSVEFLPCSAMQEPAVTEHPSEAVRESQSLLTDYYWYLNIQSWEIYSFEPDGIVNIYYTDMPLTEPSENTVLTISELTPAISEDRTYTFDGHTLIMSISGHYITLNLYDKNTNPAHITDSNAADNVTEYDGTIYFYETNWSPSQDLDSDNATYLVRLGKKG